MASNTQTPSLTMTVDEAAEALGISRAHAYQMARQGKIPTLRLGRRYLVSRKGLEELLSAKTALANQCS